MINTGKFDLRHLNRLYEDRGYDEKTGKKKDFTEAKQYLKSYLYPLIDSDFILNQKGELKRMPYDIVSKTILVKLPDELKKWYIKKNYDIYEQVCKIGQPIIKDDEINTIGTFKHTNYKPYEEYPQNIKDGVNKMLDFYKNIWSNNNEEVFKYIIQWFANVVKGGKNETILYLKTALEGVGKSRGSVFMIDHVIGKKLSKESSSMPLTSPYNYSLFGQILTCFEELENSSKYEWEAISKRLKTWATSDKITYTEKYMKSFDSSNINNYIINSNNEAIKASDGRRYVCLDINTSKFEDYKYWDDLHKTCFNDNVGEAFFSYLLEVDLSDYNKGKAPLTQNKKDAKISLLNSVYKFIKFNYVLCEKSINTQTKELYDNYIIYCNQTSNREFKKRKFLSLLREVGITYITKNSKCIVNYDISDLQKIADKFKWIHDDDCEEFIDNCIWKESISINNAESKQDKDIRITWLENENDRLKKDLSQLRKELDKYRNSINFFDNSKTPNNTSNSDNSDDEVIKITTKDEVVKNNNSSFDAFLLDFDSF